MPEANQTSFNGYKQTNVCWNLAVLASYAVSYVTMMGLSACDLWTQH